MRELIVIFVIVFVNILIFLTTRGSLPVLVSGRLLRKLLELLNYFAFFSQDSFEAKFGYKKSLEFLHSCPDRLADFWLESIGDQVVHAPSDEVVLSVVFAEKLIRQLLYLDIHYWDQSEVKIFELGI